MEKRFCLLMVLLATLAVASPVGGAGKNETKPKLKYMVFREDCFKKFFEEKKFTDAPCIKFTISKLIGLAIIAGSVILKVPQIVKLLRSQSAAGISKMMFYLEMFMYLHTSSISVHKGIPFSVYGENLIILVQNVVIVLLIWSYNKDIGFIEKLLFIVGFSAYAFFLFKDEAVTEEMWGYVSKSNLFLVVSSRLPQIMANFQNQSTGQLAFIPFLLAFAGSAARLGTVLFETNDKLYQLQFICSVMLNGMICLQFCMYWNNKPKTAEEKEKKDK